MFHIKPGFKSNSEQISMDVSNKTRFRSQHFSYKYPQSGTKPSFNSNNVHTKQANTHVLPVNYERNLMQNQISIRATKDHTTLHTCTDFCKQGPSVIHLQILLRVGEIVADISLNLIIECFSMDRSSRRRVRRPTFSMNGRRWFRHGRPFVGRLFLKKHRDLTKKTKLQQQVCFQIRIW